MTTTGSVEDYDELRTLSPGKFDIVLLRQRTASTSPVPLSSPPDGGIFVWDNNSIENENFGTILLPNLFNPKFKKKTKLKRKPIRRKGRWKRLFSGPVDIRWFGASTILDDNTSMIQMAIDSGHPVYIPHDGTTNGAFKFARRLKLRPGTVILGGGRMTSILEFTGCGIAIDDSDYGPATRSILYGFKLQASGEGVSTIGIQMTDAKIVVLENLWIEGSRSHWSVAGLSILGRQRESGDVNTYAYRILGCDISGCNGDGILVKDDAGTGGLYVFHARIQGCKGIGFNQVFGSNGPGYKCQVYVEGNDIEGNDGGQVNCDSLWGSTFKNNHLENQRVPDKPSIPVRKPSKIPPMIFGSRRVPEASSGTTTGNIMHFKIVERGTLTLNIDGGKDIKIPFETGDMKLSDIISNINGTMAGKLIASDSGGRLKLTSTKILDLKRKPELGGRLTEVELQASQVVVSGSSCLLANLGLTTGIYNAHYDWNGQFFGLTVTGNVINSVSADWAIEFPSTSGSIGIVVSGNLIIGPSDGRQRRPLAAIVSRSQLNMDISGNSCLGVFDKKDKIDYAKYSTNWEEWEKQPEFTLKSGDFVPGTVSLSPEGNTAIFNPSSSLLPYTKYTAMITTGVKDLTGKNMTADKIWSFTTGSPSDSIEPADEVTPASTELTVVSTKPGNGATKVPVTSTITATFSRPVIITPTYAPEWYSNFKSFRGQDRDGHHFLGDLRFGITTLTDTDIIDSHSYTFHIKTASRVTFTLPPHKIGKRLLFKNIGLEPTKLEAKQGTIDGMPTYTLPQYSFVELEDDGIDYWIIGSGRGGSSLVEGAPP